MTAKMMVTNAQLILVGEALSLHSAVLKRFRDGRFAAQPTPERPASSCGSEPARLSFAGRYCPTETPGSLFLQSGARPVHCSSTFLLRLAAGGYRWYLKEPCVPEK